MTDKAFNIILRLSLMLVLTFVATACVDDLRYGDNSGEIDGSMRTLSVEIGFEVEDETILSTSRADRDDALAGNSIQNINHLRLLIYGKNGTLLRNIVLMNNGTPLAGTQGGGEFTVSSIKYNPGSDNRLPDEKDDEFQDNSSGKVTFTLQLPSDEYYIYAVANADDLTDGDVADRNAMKNIRRPWIIGDISKNSEMFGIFSETPNRNATDANPVAITNKMVKLHCWLRRLASKVTVAFDGTELYDNVQVYIDTIAIFDIPKECTLGVPNQPGRDYSNSIDADARLAPSERYSASNGVYYHGAYEVVQDLTDVSEKMLLPDLYEHICNNAHPYLSKGNEVSDETLISQRHAHEAKSLFFYENLQGKGNCKKQDADGDNRIDNPNPKPGDITSGWKDGKAYGTYIQVHGYYRCTSNDGSMSFGPIRYRFMLGKNTIDDFNAERNTHYKLTLKLRGFGNDADWHIEYAHKLGISVASPQFISYLYRKKMMAVVKVSGDLPEGYYLKAEIVNDGTDDANKPWKPWGNGSERYPMPIAGTDYWGGNGSGLVRGPATGFLSLRQTNVTKVELPGWEGAPSSAYDTFDADKMLNEYFNATGVFSHNTPMGFRFYELKENPDGYSSNNVGDDGKYFVTASSKVGNKVVERIFTIPIYTRAKEIFTRTSYTGNNPYADFPRMQRIKFSIVSSINPTTGTSVEYSEIEPMYLDVIQVPRVENPKGVWRSGGTAPFHVTLMELSHTDNTKYQEFKSVGKWSAEVVNGSGSSSVITLSTTQKGSGQGNRPQNLVTRIEGESEHPIDFTINFTGTKGFAVVKVRYHNYTCEHDIFCHNGYYKTVDIVGDGVQEWSSSNVAYFKDGIAYPGKSPLQEGSMFLYTNEIGIRSINSINYGFEKNINGVNLDVYMTDGSTGKRSWASLDPGKPAQGHHWNIRNENEHIATCEDFYTMVSSTANDEEFPIKKAYGILYGDGASEVAINTSIAHGYDSEDGSPSEKGMRGVFVYNSNSLTQLFFPIGMSGYGRRKTVNEVSGGIMRYANRSAIMTGTLGDGMPLLWDLKNHMGAIYWTRTYKSEPMPQLSTNGRPYDDATKSSAFDMNYTTFGFEGFSNNAIQYGVDACFLRTVHGSMYGE